MVELHRHSHALPEEQRRRTVAAPSTSMMLAALGKRDAHPILPMLCLPDPGGEEMRVRHGFTEPPPPLLASAFDRAERGEPPRMAHRRCCRCEQRNPLPSVDLAVACCGPARLPSPTRERERSRNSPSAAIVQTLLAGGIDERLHEKGLRGGLYCHDTPLPPHAAAGRCW
nr:hypothetical protein Iba_scaffold6481CG0040 [Ipomoea batatas]